MPPTGRAYNVDWIISSNSNTHVANHRDWFTSLTPFSTNLTKIFSGYSALHVIDIGDVELPIKTSRLKSGSAAQGTLVLHDVCYAPDFPCNIFGGPIPRGTIVDFGEGTDKDEKPGASLAIFDNVGRLMR